MKEREGSQEAAGGEYRFGPGDIGAEGPRVEGEGPEQADGTRQDAADQRRREHWARARVFQVAGDGETAIRPEEVVPAEEFGERESAAAQYALQEVRPRLQTVDRLYGRLDRYSPVSRWHVLAKDYQDLVPAVMSRVARKWNPEREVVSTSAEELKKAKPALKATRLLGRRLGARLDRAAEHKAHAAMDRAAERVDGVTEFFGKIPHPKEQFVGEIDGLYRGLLASGLPAGDYFYDVVRRVSDIRHERDSSYMPAWAQRITAETNPMLVHSDELGYPINGLIWRHRGNINAGGPELARGLEQFLRGHGMRDVPRANLQPPGTMKRDLAESFAGRKLDAVESQVPEVLDAVVELLPEDGPKFAEDTRAFFDNAAWLTEHDKTGEDLRRLVLGERKKFTDF